MDTNSHPQEDSPILFQNEADDVFLIDIPYSIALAQDLPALKPAADQDATSPLIEGSFSSRKEPARKRVCLLSAPPLETAYPSNNEPKKAAARAKVLETIPLSERRLHDELIQPVVKNALQVIRDSYPAYRGQWCLPRCVVDSDGVGASGARKWKSESFRQDHSVANRILSKSENACASSQTVPPLILSSTSPNLFASISDLDGLVKNPSSDPAVLNIGSAREASTSGVSESTVPPQSSFVHCTLPLSSAGPLEDPIPGVPPSQRFNLILFDPPWPNRSVRRSGHYGIYSYTEMDILTQRLQDILRAHAYSSTGISTHEPRTESRESIASIWITNSKNSRKAACDAMLGAGFRICEEWIWIKTTVDGQPVSPLDGLWKRPYEVLLIGRKEDSLNQLSVPSYHLHSPPEINLTEVDPASVKRRVIAAVPDLHSRKPCLKGIFERLFFSNGASEHTSGGQTYTALEVFARNLTAGWWACGNEVLKFNDRKCWQTRQD